DQVRRDRRRRAPLLCPVRPLAARVDLADDRAHREAHPRAREARDPDPSHRESRRERRGERLAGHPGVDRLTSSDDSAVASYTDLLRLDDRVDIVGMARYVTLLETSDDDFDWTFGMVLRHAFLFSQAAGRLMAGSGGGSMVFVASVSGISSAPRHAAYGAAKAGLMSWVRTLAVELGPNKVRANAVAPGRGWTPGLSRFVGDKGKK